MKKRILILLGLAILGVAGAWWWSGSATRYIPAPLSSVFWQIKPGMKKDEVAKLLSSVYPNLKRGSVVWSGLTGSVGFVLDERYTLDVGMENDPKQETLFPDAIVHRDPLFYLFDNSKKHRFEIRKNHRVRDYSWETNEKKKG